MYYCYVIFSQTLQKYYVGETEDVEVRIDLHNSGFFKGAYTSRASDWELYLSIPCKTRTGARKMERFIKSQKSRLFIESLKKDPAKKNEIIKNL